MEILRLSVSRSQLKSHGTELKPVGFKGCLLATLPPPSCRHSIAFLEDIREVMAPVFLSSTKHLYFSECLKQFLGPQFVLSIKTVPGLQVASLLKANLSSDFKREDILTKRRHNTQKQLERLKFRPSWGLHHSNVHSVLEMPTHPPPKYSSRKKVKWGRSNWPPGKQFYPRFFLTSSVYGLGDLKSNILGLRS